MAGARPKGFSDWQPQGKTKGILDNVLAVIEEYRDELPLTLRQVFYRLVAQYDYDKTDLSYKRLGNLIVRARRAQIVPFGDDRTVAQPSTEGNPAT